MERRLRIVLLVRSLGYVRLFDPVVRRLLERGHAVHLTIEREKASEAERHWLAALADKPGFSHAYTDALSRDGWWTVGDTLRRVTDYLQFIGPDFPGADAMVDRAWDRVDRPYARRLAGARLVRVEAVRRPLLRLLRTLERAIPSSATVKAELAASRPDVLVLVPHLMPGVRHSEYVKAARALGIRTCMCIASWDNLSSKAQIRERPDRVVVWNEVQKREAVELHGVPAERVVVTGAQSFDQWFERRPRPREDFCARVGLDPARPYVLYLAGALFPGPLTEAEFVRDRWIPQLRRDPRLRDVGVLVRPHPRRNAQWDAVELTGEQVRVWPPAGVSMPVDEEARADFFDSIFHSAAVAGLNTTAMIEAAIVGRPVLTVLDPDFAESQTGTYHFDYLLNEAGGMLVTSRTFDEHRAAVLAAIDGDDASAARRRRFVEAFARPHGIERPALPFVVDAIEEVGALGAAAPAREPVRLVPFRLSMSSALAVYRIVRRLGRSAAGLRAAER